jgi:hypothetical protein
VENPDSEATAGIEPAMKVLQTSGLHRLYEVTHKITRTDVSMHRSSRSIPEAEIDPQLRKSSKATTYG